MKTGIYIRVSTRDQELEGQEQVLSEYCKNMGYPIFGIYRDKESGGTSNRPAFKKLFEDAAMHKFDLVLFWAMVENPLKLTT